MSKINAILIINPFGIGDVIFSTALMRSLHASLPDARIYYLCNKKTAPVMRADPLITDVFVYERDEFLAAQRSSFIGWWAKIRSFIRAIRAARIDIAFDLSLNTQYGFFAWWAGIRRRVGLDYRNRCLFLNRRLSIAGYTDKHVAEYYLDLLQLVNIPVADRRLEVRVDPSSRAWAADLFKQRGIGEDRLVIGIAPLGGDAFGKDAYIKRWPAECFSAVIDRLVEKYNAVILLFAGPKEKEEIMGIVDGVRAKSNVFEFSSATLPQTVALIDRSELFIGNDTGPLRFADGLKKKIVALFGPVDDRVYGPYPPEKGRTAVLKKDMPCRPCYRGFRLQQCLLDKKCLRDITVDEVMRAVDGLFRGDGVL